MPYEMRLIFKLPRITKTGSYPYQFEEGFLKNLKGEIKVINYGATITSLKIPISLKTESM